MKKKDGMQGPPAAWLERLWDWELSWRHRIADWMQLRVVRWPLRVVRGLFWGYVVLSMMVFTCLLMGGGELETLPPVKQATLPGMPGRLKPKEYRQSFIHFMDSVEVNARLRQRFDSLLQARQGFADTMRQLEEYYK